MKVNRKWHRKTQKPSNACSRKGSREVWQSPQVADKRNKSFERSAEIDKATPFGRPQQKKPRALHCLDFFQNLSQKMSRKDGKKVESHVCCFLNLDAFGAPRAPHGAPRWLPRVFRRAFQTIQGQFLQLACNVDKENRTTKTFQEEVRETGCAINKRQLHPQQRGMAQTQARCRGWAKPTIYCARNMRERNSHFPLNLYYLLIDCKYRLIKINKIMPCIIRVMLLIIQMKYL